jgi:hypothetical protein
MKKGGGKMKKFISLIAVSVVIIIAFGTLSCNTPIVETSVVKETAKTDSSALKSRFTNMLNHNYVYGEDFEQIEKIIGGSIISMLDSREGDYIKQSILKAFAFNMYGVKLADFEQSETFPKRDGYFFIPPKGYSIYKHEIISVKENEDKTFSVTSTVNFTPHDGEPLSLTAVSLFVKNSESSFGYNLISSDILYSTEKI